MNNDLAYATSIWRCLLLVACVASGCAEPAAEPSRERRAPELAALAVARYPTTPATSIEEVIERLDAIIEVARARADRNGYFAAQYRLITREIWRAIQRGAFQDGPRMDRLVAMFVNRYLAALEAWQSGGTPPECWRQAFELAGRDDTMIVQHQIVAMGAHMAFDLPIAAAQFAPGQAIYGLESDYDRINDILIGTLAPVQDALAQVSPHLGLLDELNGDLDEGLFGVSIQAVRSEAWQNAVAYALAPARFHRTLEFLLDAQASARNRLVSEPVSPFYELAQRVGEAEEQDVALVIETLNAAIP